MQFTTCFSEGNRNNWILKDTGLLLEEQRQSSKRQQSGTRKVNTIDDRNPLQHSEISTFPVQIYSINFMQERLRCNLHVKSTQSKYNCIILQYELADLFAWQHRLIT